MGKAGRIACIFTPFVLSVAALACLVVIFLAGNVKNKNFNDLFFLRLNMTDIEVSDKFKDIGGVSDTTFNTAFDWAKSDGNLKNYYTIYLRNYCSWNKGEDPWSNCTATKVPFSFDPLEAWGFNAAAVSRNADLSKVLPTDLQKGLDLYRKLSHALFYLYSIGIAVTVLTVLIGITAIFSRWGSFITTFFATASSISVVVASALVTAMFPVLRGALETTLVNDNNRSDTATLGTRMIVLTWFSAVFAFAASIFWTCSICCCSGKSPYNPGSKDSRRTRAESTPYTYSQVGTPAPQQPMQMNIVNRFTMPGQGNAPQQTGTGADRHTAYEPYRT